MISLTSDIADTILQQTLNQNTLGLNNAIERMTTGYKINHAKDNAANFSITKSLSVKISSMLQVQQNAADGIDLLQTAEGGLEEINTLLQRLRCLAVQASNETNASQSRSALQQEADQIVAQIQQIKETMQYNGMNLYETKQEEETSPVARLSSSVRVKSRAMARSAVPAAMSNDTVENSIDFAAGATHTVDIDGVSYTITNMATNASSLSYSKDLTTGELTFFCSSFKIQGQLDAAHNIKICGSYNQVHGGDLGDTIKIGNSSSIYNYIYGGKGNDTLIGDTTAAYVYLYGEDGDDTITSSNGSYTYCYGGAGNDTINISNVASNVSYGGDGDDIFNIKNSSGSCYGEDGEDSFVFSKSSYTVDGGSGTNALEVDNPATLVSFNVPGANSFVEVFTDNKSRVININGIDYEVTKTGSYTNFTYKINSNGAIVFTSYGFKIVGEKNKAHNVILQGGSVVFYGGNLNDRIQNESTANNIYGLGGDDTIIDNRGYSTIHGGDGDDNITINGQYVSVFGDDGNDTISIKASCTFVDSGAGDDTVQTLVGNLNGLVLNGNSGNDTLSLAGSVQNSHYAGFNDSVNNAEAINLGALETKNITINGINYEVQNLFDKQSSIVYSYDPVTGQIAFGSIRTDIKGQLDAKHNVIIRGSSGRVTFHGGNLDDTIINAGYANVIHGGAGNDTLINKEHGADSQFYGGDGDDDITLNTTATVSAGNGNDKITINRGYSSMSISGGNGDDTYIINAPANVSDSSGDNVFHINTNGIGISGSSGADTFYVKGNNNTVSGLAGDDYFVVDGSNNTLDGGAGANYFIDNGIGNTFSNVVKDPNSGVLQFSYSGEVKTLVLNGKTYTITNNSASTNSLSYSLNTNVDITSMEGSGFTITAEKMEAAKLSIRGDNNIINGSDLDDTITIDSGTNNIVNGLGGNDRLVMESANNSLLGGEGNDVIILKASTNKLVDGGLGNDTLNIESGNNTNIQSGSGDNNIVVSGTHNTIFAQDGNNSITVNSTSNTITAGDGDNNFVINSSDNTVTAGAGKNSIGISGNNNTLTSNSSKGTVNIYGDSNNVTLMSGDSNVVIKGNSNTYNGADGVDTIKISGDNNVVSGGGSNDRFSVLSGNNNTVDGNEGARNTLIDKGTNTTAFNTLEVVSQPFEVKFKVDIGSGEDKYIKTSINLDLTELIVDFSTRANALDSLELIDGFIKQTESELLSIGSTINRLESVLEAHSIKLNNLISTRSTIQDSDVAEESSAFIRYQILQQASSTLMSASRNLRAENVMGLLRGLNG